MWASESIAPSNGTFVYQWNQQITRWQVLVWPGGFHGYGPRPLRLGLRPSVTVLLRQAVLIIIICLCWCVS